MYGGIDQLVDTYKGNPQPLDAKVQKAQQGQPPGEIPADLEEALALQEIAELRTGAQNQQAMQAGGAQPSVVEKLRQMLGGIQQQAQMAQAPQQPSQGQPVMAARGGSIDQLMSNLGRYYAGGGIVAFNGKDGSDVPTEAELEAQRKADREKIDALAKALGQTGGEYAGKSMAALADIASLIPRGLAGAVDTALIRPARALGADVGYLSPALTPGNQNPDTMTPFYDRYIRAKEETNKTPSEAPTTQSSKPGTTYEKPGNIASPTVNNMYTDKDGKTFVRPAGMSDESWKKLIATARTEQLPTSAGPSDRMVPRYPITASTPKPPAAPAAPRPSTGGPNTGGPAAPAAAKLDPNSLRGLLEDYIRPELKLSPEAERDKAVEFTKKTMGLDALLGEKERRANEREEMIKQAQGERMPAWVEALAGAGKPVRGGLGTLLSQMGGTAQATREGYQAQDLAYQKELAQLRDVITDAKINGNTELVKQGVAAYKEVDARRRAAATNATSLVKTDEDTEMRKELAKGRIAATAANAGAAANSKNMANAINAVKNDEVINRLQKDADALSKSLYPKDRAKLADVARQIETRQNAIYKQFGVLEGLSTIAAAPGAASPGGTSLKYNPKTGKIE